MSTRWLPVSVTTTWSSEMNTPRVSTSTPSRVWPAAPNRPGGAPSHRCGFHPPLRSTSGTTSAGTDAADVVADGVIAHAARHQARRTHTSPSSTRSGSSPAGRRARQALPMASKQKPCHGQVNARWTGRAPPRPAAALRGRTVAVGGQLLGEVDDDDDADAPIVATVRSSTGRSAAGPRRSHPSAAASAADPQKLQWDQRRGGRLIMTTSTRRMAGTPCTRASSTRFRSVTDDIGTAIAGALETDERRSVFHGPASRRHRGCAVADGPVQNLVGVRHRIRADDTVQGQQQVHRGSSTSSNRTGRAPSSARKARTIFTRPARCTASRRTLQFLGLFPRGGIKIVNAATASSTRRVLRSRLSSGSFRGVLHVAASACCRESRRAPRGPCAPESWSPSSSKR